MGLIYWWLVPSCLAGWFMYKTFPENPKAEDEDFITAIFFTIVWPLPALMVINIILHCVGYYVCGLFEK